MAAHAPQDRQGYVQALETLGNTALAARRPATALAWFDKLPAEAQQLGALRAKLERANATR